MKNINNNKNIFLVVVLIIVLVIVFIDINFQNKTHTFTTNDGITSFTLKGLYIEKEIGEYDLYLSKGNNINIGVFTYDLDKYDYLIGEEILNEQINYFLDTRNNMSVFKEKEVIELDDKKITKVEYSGIKDGYSECIYVFSIIKFKNKENYVVYLHEVVVKDDYEKYYNELIDILKNAKLNNLN